MKVQPNDVIAAWISAGDPGVLGHAILRLSRHVPEAQKFLDGHLSDPLDRALAGLSKAPQEESSLKRRVLSGLAACDAGQAPRAEEAAALEKEALGDPDWWIHAARIHVIADIARERTARSRLADQNLPYVFPGELHPLMVDLLAAGDRVLPALHVDWTRKLSKWIAEDLIRVDCQRQAMWFWPVIGSMDPGRLVRPLARLAEGPKMPPGGMGLAAAYCHRSGAPGNLLLARCDAEDRLVLALARAGAERRDAQAG